MEARKRQGMRLPRLAAGKPLRYLGRRIVQAMAEHGVANYLLADRAVPSGFIVLRLAADDSERERLEEEFEQSRQAIEREVQREAAARHFRLRSALAIDFRVVTAEELVRPEACPALGAAAASSRADLGERLRAEEEVVVCRRTRSVTIESDPPGAVVYVDGAQAERLTPCTLPDLTGGRYAVRLVLPGFVRHEGTLTVEEEGSRRQRYRAVLEPEPPMAIVEVVTYPPRAQLRINGETWESPVSLRLPAGRHRMIAELDDYHPVSTEFEVRMGDGGQRIEARLEYGGPDWDIPVGRLLVYPAGTAPAPDPDAPPNPVAEFFRGASAGDDWAGDAAETPEEYPLYRGVLLIGRDDPVSNLEPDVCLWDAANTVSRGCHAWLHIYADPGTGAEYNTIVVHNNSRKGTRVDGRLVVESLAIGDDTWLEVGAFRIRITKETPRPQVRLRPRQSQRRERPLEG